jgi:hypothetical protein
MSKLAKLNKLKFIPAGDLPKEQQKDRDEYEENVKEFFANPLIPWWTKVASVVCPVRLHKPERTPTWCKRCGRKHSKRAACALVMVEDLTTEPKQSDDPEQQRPTKRVGHYIQLSTLKEQTA